MEENNNVTPEVNEPVAQEATPVAPTNNNGGKGPSNKKVIAGLVLGIISLVFTLLGCVIPLFALVGTIIALVVAIVAIILSAKGKKECTEGIATAALVISIIAVVLAGIFFVTCGICTGCVACGAAGLAGSLY